ncbi:Outer membrane protein (porin) [Phocoenobacter uteri]|uniref:Outer membrane protein (Porin) n=1 Tax=Phocoenobacter uteri TaxID=146806 RepID=A0A379CCL6_9PAST|nr:porin [Phocoenobacter uteri]MDG6881466.1 hypothetical protein [Phocoenobacter uteri]SUB59496.1 Outer membrane protein (porin) [Phocoenobacter uteri]
MKKLSKTLIALTVATLAASAANASIVYENDGTKVSVYGSLRVKFAKLENSRNDLLDDGSKFWINVSQDFEDGYSAFGALQLRPSTKYDDSFSDGVSTHRLYAGMKKEGLGEISFGNQTTIADKFKTVGFTEGFGGITRAGQKNPGGETYRTYGRTQHGLNTSGKKTIHIQSEPWNGFTFGADYILDKNAERIEYNKKEKKEGKNFDNTQYQAGVLYYKRIDDLKMKTNVVYGHNKALEFLTTDSVGVGFGFTYKDYEFGIDYIYDKNNYVKDHKEDNTDKEYKKGDKTSQKSLQVGLKYQITYPWDIYTSYRQTTYADDVKNKGFAVGTHYQFNKKIRVYLEYATNKAENVYQEKDSKTKKLVDAYPRERQNGYYAGFRVDF